MILRYAGAGGFPSGLSFALARIFFLKGGCWVMRRGLLWRCKMFDRKERGGG